MNSKFDSCDNLIPPLPPHHSDGTESCEAGSCHCPDILKRDRFELLNAYLDSEVTADERRQVEDWLVNDPIAQRLHCRLLKLRQGMRTMPVPQTTESVQHQVDSVIQRGDRRFQVMIAWGSTAVAALFIGLLSGIVPGDRGVIPQVAESPTTPLEKSSNPSALPKEEVLMIALDKPVVTIPKAPISVPEHTFKELLLPTDTN